jgi:flagellar basal body-associated protein FliL
MEEKAQAQIEIILGLLLVVAAATAVGLFLKNAASTIGETAQNQQNQNP